jgi:nitrogen fixation NifU-like protein
MSLYQDEIMDHYRNPRNFGCKDRKSNVASHLHNPSCGDKIEVRMSVENGIVTDICFEGYGCALSTASASILTEFVKGKPVTEVEQVDSDKVLLLLNIEVTPARMKCALLPLEAIQEAINSNVKQ